MRTKLSLGAAILIASTVMASAPDTEKVRPDFVRATEPTVMTVHADAERPQALKSAGSTVEKRSRIRRGSAGVSGGAGRLAGWLLNASDDIPSARERAESERFTRR